MAIAVPLMIVGRHKLAEKLTEAFDRFQGDPPAGPHASPSGDAVLLRNRLKTIREGRR